MKHRLARPLILLALATPAVSLAQSGGFPASLDSATLNRWLVTQTTLKPTNVIAVGGGRVVGFVSRTSQSPGRVSMSIRTEIVTEAAAQDAMARSEAVVLEVDCDGRRAKAGPTQTYSQHNLTGQLGLKPGWADWATAGPATTLDRMVQAACTTQARSAAGLPPAQSPTLSAPAPSPVAAEPLAEPAAAPEPAPAVEAPEASPPPEPPETRDPLLAPLEAAPEPLAPPSPPMSRPAPPPPSAASQAQAAGRFASWAQVAVTGSDAEAREALARLAAQTPDAASRPTLVEESPIGGQTFYRALVGGFTDGVEAGAFCQKLTDSGATCTVRQR